MDFKETGFLKVLGDVSFPEKKVVINPNDGFDLDLLMSDTTVAIHYGKSPATWTEAAKGLYGNVYQSNDCKLGTVELSGRALNKMGNPKRVRLHIVTEGPYPQLLVEAE